MLEISLIMNNTQAINDLVRFLTENPETPKMIAKGVIEYMYAINPAELERVGHFAPYLAELVAKLSAITGS